MEIEKRTFVVTGAGSGLGAAVARMLVARSANVVLVDIRDDEGRTVASELGSTSRFVRADVTNETDAATVVETAIKTFGGLNGLINCAGIAPGEKIVGREGPHRLDSFARAVNVNLVGTFNMLRVVAAQLVKEPQSTDGERGVIINTASIAAFDG